MKKPADWRAFFVLGVRGLSVGANSFAKQAEGLPNVVRRDNCVALGE
ncbi:hypothetical protein [Metapseudomonas resinovorans]|nr:hypothetical protein [Pseudomonas resinovorans]